MMGATLRASTRARTHHRFMFFMNPRARRGEGGRGQTRGRGALEDGREGVHDRVLEAVHALSLMTTARRVAMMSTQFWVKREKRMVLPVSSGSWGPTRPTGPAHLRGQPETYMSTNARTAHSS